MKIAHKVLHKNENVKLYELCKNTNGFRVEVDGEFLLISQSGGISSSLNLIVGERSGNDNIHITVTLLS